MKRCLSLVFATAVIGCQQKVDAPPNPDSYVSKSIVLKDVTTGEKPSAALKAGYNANWTYFGEKRVVQHTTDQAGVVTKIVFNLGSSWDGRQLQEELEKKLTEENGRNIRFDCREKEVSLALMDGLRVTETTCTVRSDAQLLTLKRVFPVYEADARKYPTMRILYDKTEVSLLATDLEKARVLTDDARAFRNAPEKHKTRRNETSD